MTLRRIILLRHGQTDYNVEGRMQGHLDSHLTTAGHDQAAAAAPMLAELAPDRIVSSDLRRAVDTAEVVGSACGLPVKFDARLRETHLGRWQGQTVAEIDHHYPGAIASWRSDPDWAPPDGESRVAVVARLDGSLGDGSARRARRADRRAGDGPDRAADVGVAVVRRAGQLPVGRAGPARRPSPLAPRRLQRRSLRSLGARTVRITNPIGPGPRDTAYCRGVPVAVVTDSTAYLPAGLAVERAIRVVPLEVRLGTRVGREGVDIDAAAVSAALADRHLVVQTSRPAPADFATVYRAALDAGATGVVSVHLSRELSGTWEAARLAAEEVGPDLVRVVDSRATAMGLGFAVLAAADAAADGARADAVEEAAADVAARCRVFFCVDTLDRLRRGGRIGAAAALVGSALAVKPLLHVAQGRIVPLEKVRTTARAAQRMVELAVRAAGDGPADLAVHHLGAAERAEELAERLRERLPRVARLLVSEVGAVIGAHARTGLLGIVVVPRRAGH